ncbi:ribonuclease III [Allofrancisella guangzhouensis]|uniref:Ribonuclease 3 n=1 Tax=Allofrancisella guangzhouensis TaxID=594679 RepID=A0A0A8E5W2_9GAMM|nr:ribonuclease III [Allofrancisella guangzhouensis]AJC49369.1 ribonuclease III [Allofrancisella guangzhouensis]MBK2026990.1 ribonuclease III [Allofrancisella guangzhouensis]MBK2043898.1 ribonuclease III [Allofrancisella guangzhouensis]MBK2044989.1 ribonuclease III [Allofrancisella guangzhouensis]
MIPDYSRLYRILGYSFKDHTILTRALTHRSKTKKNYERLEFLGDSILGFVIAESLYYKFPKFTEGELTQIRSKLVKGATLSKLALDYKIDEFVILGGSESGSQRREKILEDVFEAVIGAIYLDSDFANVKTIILSWYAAIFSKLDTDTVRVKDNKSRLQEILLQSSMSLPKYEIIAVFGKDHEQIFEVGVIVQELNLETKAQDTSRKKAEQKAAGGMIELLKNQGLHEKK